MRSEESEGDVELLNCLFSKVYEYQDGSSGFTCPTLEEQTCGLVQKNTSAASTARPKRVKWWVNV